jgi:hypothetical protein
MLLKLMGQENMPDDDPRKTSQIIDDIQECKLHYLHTGEAALAVLYRKPCRGTMTETFVLKANAYLMNDNGKTLQGYSCIQAPHSKAGEVGSVTEDTPALPR